MARSTAGRKQLRLCLVLLLYQSRHRETIGQVSVPVIGLMNVNVGAGGTALSAAQ